MDTKKSAGEPSSRAACSPCNFVWPHRYYPGERHVCNLSVGHNEPHVCGSPIHEGEHRTEHPANAGGETQTVRAGKDARIREQA